MSFDADEGLEQVVARAMIPHRHKRGQVCGECVRSVVRAVHAYAPPQWPPPRPRIDLRPDAQTARRSG